MSQTLDLVEGMRIGIPFRATSVIEIDSKRFAEYDYEFPEQASITLIEASDGLADLEGYYGSAIVEVSSVEESETGYLFVTLRLLQVEIEGKLSATRGDRLRGGDPHARRGTSDEEPIDGDGRVNRRY